MMRRVLAVEIEELLFDTRPVRAAALCEALAQEGVIVSHDAVAAAHAGVTGTLALKRLSAVHTLDGTGRELVLHRAAALASRALDVQAPAFDTDVCNRLAALATELPLAVVTRASLEQAHRWLAAAGLEAGVATVRSLEALEPDAYVTVWREVLQRTFAEQGVAIAALPLLAVAARAGFRTVHIADARDDGGAGYHADVTLASLSQVDAGFLAALFPKPHAVHPAP